MQDPALEGEFTELISVRLGDQLFALDIMTVREIRGWSVSTRLPQAPPFVLGMMNLRGAVLPVLDLGALLGFARVEPDGSSVAVVTDIGHRVVGLVVDAVCDIVSVPPGDIRPPPRVTAGADLVRGVFTAGADIVTVLQLEGALPDEGGEIQAA